MDRPAVGRLASVEWVDTTNIAGWLTPDEIEEFARDGKWVCQNVGWITYTDEECVVVSARRADCGQFGLSERIGWKMISRIDYYEGP